MPATDKRNLFYSETEVKNPGYPGAILLLGFFLELAGIAICISTLRRGNTRALDFLILLILTPGAILITKSIRARRAVRLAQSREAGECPHCGYNRQGLAESTKCPECGFLDLKESPSPTSE